MKTIEYTPRRANKQRWLQNAPDYILDCFNFPTDGGPEVLFTGSLLGRMGTSTRFADTYIMGLCEQGSFELKAHEAAAYRYANGKKRVRWDDLPEDFWRRIQSWAESD